ncbi:MAG: hypothetical protein D6814_16280 [Calditrichaeota bacterium]|nr:MAG: hypothetical protein D6814_16280 [Calditrichota bacterium]
MSERSKFQVIFPVFFLCAFFFPLNCAKSPQVQRQPSEWPPDFQLQWSQGGGFSGRWQGFSIDAQGKVVGWTGKLPGANAKNIGQLDPESMKQLWDKIQKSHLFSMKLQNSGNLTYRLKIVAEGKTNTLTWATLPDQPDSAAVAVGALYQFCQNLVRKLQNP